MIRCGYGHRGNSVGSDGHRLNRRACARGWLTTGMTVIAPVTYAALYDLSFRTDANPLNGPDGFMTLALVALKLLTIAALVTGVHQIGTRITARPSLAWTAATIWAFVGVALAASIASAKNRGTALGTDQLWPGQSNGELLSQLDPGPGPGWNTTSILTAEIIAVLVLSLGVAMLLRLAGRRLRQRRVTVLALVGILGGLLIYDQIVGWPVMFDFDPFVGDAILGALTYELMLFPLPLDPLGALALAAIAVANGLILVVARNPPTGR